MNLEKSALLVIDMQNDLIAEQGKQRQSSISVYEEGRAIISSLQRLISAAREAGVPVIYTRTMYRPDYVDANPRAPSRKVAALVRGSWGSEVIDELRPQEGDFVIEKHRSSAFFDTVLKIVLRGLGIRTLILTGISTNIAVESTVRDAHANDYESVVVSDCTAAATREFHEASLKSVGTFFATVASSGEVISALRSAP